MKKLLLFSAAAVIILLNSCSPAGKSTGVWVNKEKITGKTYHSIFIVVMTADTEARNALETDLAAAAEARGYKAVKSIDKLPPSLSNPAEPSKEEVINKVKESGCDGVFVASLLRSEEDVRYVPGTTTYAPMRYYAWNGRYWSYYHQWYPSVTRPGYYEKDKTYFMQGNFYDAASEEILWSAQSKLFEPSSVKKFSANYTKTLVRQLEQEGLLKK